MRRQVLVLPQLQSPALQQQEPKRAPKLLQAQPVQHREQPTTASSQPCDDAEPLDLESDQTIARIAQGQQFALNQPYRPAVARPIHPACFVALRLLDSAQQPRRWQVLQY